MMLQKYVLALAAGMVGFAGFAQDPKAADALPVNIMVINSDTSKPLVLYTTGDGGWNKFSRNLAWRLATKGYPVIALNAYKYFWQKKTPEQYAAAMSALLTTYQKQWKKRKVLLIGYSFGADVLPFAYRHLPGEIASAVENITLLSPSSTTDFEIHLMVMLGSKGGGSSVPAAINAISDKPVTIIFGEGENDYKNGDLTGKNVTLLTLPGGHHYDGNEASVVNIILQHIPVK